MKWIELQTLWQEQNTQIAENTRINKEILKRMLRLKPEKKIRWEALKKGGSLIFGPVFITFLFIKSSAQFNHYCCLTYIFYFIIDAIFHVS